MEHVQQFECDTPDCIYWKNGDCTKLTAVTIQEHRCVNYERRPERSIVIYVEGGNVQEVYGSPDLADVDVEILDMDNAKCEENGRAQVEQRLKVLAATHKTIS